jgi:hypothetical protein
MYIYDYMPLQAKGLEDSNGKELTSGLEAVPGEGLPFLGTQLQQAL